MNRGVLLLVLLNFAVIGALPIVFFRRDGRLNLRWWLTGSPFFACPLLLLGGLAGWWSPAAVPAGMRDLPAVLLSASSIALVFYTLGTHRVRLALWHQTNDAPQSIVTYGAYARIRHPFYSAFILAMLAGTVFFPHPATLGLVAYVFLALNVTAAGEEKRLSASEFGASYAEYVKRTGRFFPRFRGGAGA